VSTFYSNGKLLLTGEYVVLDGATALALPTQQGQSLSITPIDESHIIWTSFLEDNSVWFTTHLKLPSLAPTIQNSIIEKLVSILKETQKLNPHFLKNNQGFKIQSKLSFQKDWGLGSSSTLINNIASWANVNPYVLLQNTFGGSGYDIACARTKTPITFSLKGNNPSVQSIDFSPSFKNHLFFVYLNKKQNSRQSIAQYKTATKSNLKQAIIEITQITQEIQFCSSLKTFENLLTTHETIISKLVQLPTITNQHFSDYKEGVIKSLGGWGGDFILVTGSPNAMDYFREKGFTTIIPYSEMILLEKII